MGEEAELELKGDGTIASLQGLAPPVNIGDTSVRGQSPLLRGMQCIARPVGAGSAREQKRHEKAGHRPAFSVGR